MMVPRRALWTLAILACISFLVMVGEGRAEVTLEQDREIQKAHPGIVEAVKGRLGARYAGLTFNLKTGKFVIPIAPGASKTMVEGAIDRAPAAYPLVAHTLAELQGSAASLEAELRPLIAEGKAQVVVDEKANKPRVYYAAKLPLSTKEGIKTMAASYGGTATGSPTLMAYPDGCAVYYPPEEPGGFCDDQPLGGVTIWETPYTHPGGSGPEPHAGCSAGFDVRTVWPERPVILTAGHCIVDTRTPSGTWVPREVWKCRFPPFGECGLVAPYPPSGECILHIGPYHQDETGDFGLMYPEGCQTAPRVATWYEAEPTRLVESWQHGIFNCIEPGCNTPIPAHEEAYAGLYQCHYGMNARYEQEERFGGPLGNCGITKYVDTAIAIGYAAGPITVHHLDLVCSVALPGDSGSPSVAPARYGHDVATGILIAGSQTKTTYCGTSGNAYSDQIGPALSSLGVEL